MPMNGYSVGRDVSIDIFGQVNGVVTPKEVTMFEKKQRTNRVEIKRIDGIVDFLELPQGWEGSIEVERADNTLDDYFATLEANYYSGKNIVTATISETIQEPNGSISQYRYERVMFKYSDAGQAKNDASIKLKLDWVASKRRKVV